MVGGSSITIFIIRAFTIITKFVGVLLLAASALGSNFW
jgi:hypothetical protein